MHGRRSSPHCRLVLHTVSSDTIRRRLWVLNVIKTTILSISWAVVGIATGYGLYDRGIGVPSPGRVKNFLFSVSSRPALGSTQHPIQWVPRVKRPRREADHSPPTSAEVKKIWIYTSTPSYAFIGTNLPFILHILVYNKTSYSTTNGLITLKPPWNFNKKLL
jgi:hypothetical protein